MQVNFSPMATKTQTLAERIVARRTEIGLTPADLACIAGVSISAVLQWESGKAQNLKLENLVVIADALGVNPRWLATGQGPKLAEPQQATAWLIEAFRKLFSNDLEAAAAALSRMNRADTKGARQFWHRIASGFVKTLIAYSLAVPLLWGLWAPQADAKPHLNLGGSTLAFARQVSDLAMHCILMLLAFLFHLRVGRLT